ncbi:MAG: trigger factor [Lentisphaeria bacterium]
MESKSINLDITCTETAPCCLTMAVTVPAARAKSVYDNISRKISGQARLPGFRAGKLPDKILFARFGKQILDETMESLVRDSINEAIQEKGYNLAARPRLLEEEKIEYKLGQDFSFNSKLEIFPEITLPEYKGIQVSRDAVEVSDTEVNDMIREWLEQRSTVEKVDRPAQKNDMLKLSYTAQAPEELLDNPKLKYLLKAENTWLMLREPEMLPGTQTALLAVSAGDQKDIDITFPENFRIDEFKGKSFSYHFDISEVQGQLIPELNEKIFQEVGVKDKEELDTRVRENLLSRKNQEAEQKVDEQVIEALLSGQDFPVPPSMLKVEQAHLLERYRSAATRGGIKEEELKDKVAAFEAQAEQEAVRKIRRTFLLMEIGKKENIYPEHQEVTQVITEMAQREGVPLEVAGRKLKENGQLESIMAGILEMKVLRFLVNSAEQVEVKP